MTDNGLPDRYDLTKDQDRDDRRKHLELVSAVVGRMAAASAAAKGWSITLAGAAFGVAVIRDKSYLILLGVLALVVFGIVDALYLYNEKRFRALYAAIADQNAVKPLSMDLSVLDRLNKKESFFSWSVVSFYGPLILGGLIIFAIALCNDESEADKRIPSPTVTTSTVTITETTTTQTTATSTPEPSPTPTTQAPPPPASPTTPTR
ncbi:hypothetical protein MycrhN_3811 [Mycolicibacterium rhodesiae NBB3]|uniref:Transmembrane protein n=1 Tax=Mycolicibacterium rhodesiae (strain NBB3) TaxID=710685 RepID=G8RWL9_MYCRN|nr:hypothetical protein [Mycolicibacterium rhodesiae]AEV74327.1 hypothetical protein MycrhN_3811 [Mycolicibacterium rhodesiae NBB3]